MKALPIIVFMLLSACASEMMKTYLGKDISEVVMDQGPPAGVMDLPNGRRAFIWTRTETIVAPTYTSINASQSGRWLAGTATTTGGHVSSWDCVYTFIGQPNRTGGYTVVDFRKPSLACE